MTTTTEKWIMYYKNDARKAEEMSFEVKIEKGQPLYKFLGDTCESYAPRFQKIKSVPKGDYLVVMGQRYYFGYEVEQSELTPNPTPAAQSKIQKLEQEILDKQQLMQDRERRIASGQTDMDDCFVSQRSNEQAISLAKAKIEILQNGGLAPFQCLRDLETGEVVTTTIFKGQYGLCWRIDDAYQAKFGKYVGAAARESTYTRKGLKLDEVDLPAWACFETNGTGMAGAYSAYVKVFPSRVNYALEQTQDI